MAEFALGLTKTAVAGTVSRVKSAIEEEAKLRASVHDDLIFITGEFEMMQSFLSASNAGERASSNQVVRTWVRQLRSLAFDVENCVEFVVHLDEPSPWDWVRRLSSSVAASVCMGMAKPPLPLDAAVAEIKRLKARVEDVSQRNTRYNLIGGDDSPAPADARTSCSSTGTTFKGAFQVLLDVWRAAGKLTDIGLRELIDSHASELQVISLWRAGGAAASDHAPDPNNHVLMMKKAYDDPHVCRRFQNRAWVKLSALHPFNPAEFINSLLAQFRSRNHDHHHHNEEEDSIPKLLLQLKQHRYLVVIEQELTTVADWDAIRMYLPDGNNGSRVVVSTNSFGIALVCTGDPYQVSELKRFSHDRGLYAFFPKGCGHRSGMGEFIWQLRHCGVISLFWGSHDDISQFLHELGEEDNTTINKLTELDKSRVLDAVKFEHCIWFQIYPNRFGQKFKLVDLAWNVVCRYHLKDGKSGLSEEFQRMCERDAIEWCRNFLTEHNYLIFIKDLESSTDWDLIKHQLLCESTRGRMVVITTEDNQSVARHCVDHDEYRALNLRGVMKGFDEQNHKGIGGIKEEGTYELDDRGDEVWDNRYPASLPDMMYSLWGISGVGKTAMVRQMYNAHSKLYRMHVWVDVPYPFNLTELCRRLLLDFYSGDVDARESAAVGMMEGQDPIQWCCKILREDKWLLIIDHLRSTQDWDMLKATLLSQPIRGTTFVITCEESIAKHCTDSEKSFIVNVKGLENDVALDLFKKVAWQGKELSELDSKTQKISKLLVSKCGGLPGVIVAIAKSARSYPIWWLERMTSDFMGTIEQSSEFPTLRGLFCWMQSYFDACSDELKPCIFYMSVFPVEQRIRSSHLLRRWIAEGYSSGGGGTAEEKGRKLLTELMELSIVYQEERQISTYKVNGFFHEYIKSRPMEDNLVFALEGSCSPSSRLTGQHLTISSSWDRDVNVFKDIDLSRLRSLTVFGEWRSFLVCDKMKILRVLDLEGTSASDVTTSVTNDVLEQIVKLLPRLKFLSLRGCVHITCLPDSLGDMRQLETLDARHTSIVELPPAIIAKLHKLQYISVGTSTDTSHRLLQTKISTPPPSSIPPPPTPPPQEHSRGGTSPFLRVTAAAASAVQEVSTKISGGCMRRAHNLVASSRNIYWECKNQLDLRTRRRVAANGGGVEVAHAVAVGIGSLTYLHTLGVVNVAGGRGASLFLEELKKLTQLRKLGLSGINRKNWSQLCDAISGNLHHLESLSLQLMLLENEGGSFDFACFDDIAEPPKTLKRLKVLYTTTGGGRGACVRPVWLKKKLPSLERFDQDVTILSQEDICLLFGLDGLPQVKGHSLNVKPNQHQQLSFDEIRSYYGRTIPLDSLRIDCSSGSSTVTFGDLVPVYVKAIDVHCCGSCGSSSCLRISGLRHVCHLKEVRVTGPCSQELKEDLVKQLNDHPHEPVPKLLIVDQ